VGPLLGVDSSKFSQVEPISLVGQLAVIGKKKKGKPSDIKHSSGSSSPCLLEFFLAKSHFAQKSMKNKFRLFVKNMLFAKI
jgi:hypothetical protein